MKHNIKYIRLLLNYLTTPFHRLVLIIILSAPGFFGFSQVNSLSDQYQANLFLLNPAIAGTGRYGTLSIHSRQQWVGWDGAPASQSVTFHTKWAKSKARFTPTGFLNKGINTIAMLVPGEVFFTILMASLI